MRSLVVALGSLFVAQAALACSCLGSGDAATKFAHNDVVFVGTVVGFGHKVVQTRVIGKQPFSDAELGIRRLKDGTGIRRQDLTYCRVRVKAAWKGIRAGKTVKVSTGFGPSCGFEASKGVTYLIYAKRSTRWKWRLETSLCSGNRTGQRAREDWDRLGAPGSVTRRGFSQEDL